LHKSRRAAPGSQGGTTEHISSAGRVGWNLTFHYAPAAAPGAGASAMSTRQLVVIGASSGGIEALRTVAAGLPPDFGAAICVVLHTSPDAPAALSAILNGAGPLPATFATDRSPLGKGQFYVAPPDHHLLVEPGILRITKGPQENRFRPAIDPLFRSAAQVYGPAAIGVILTGALDDGTAGLWMIKRMGGVAIVQDPADALFPSMPSSALRHVEADYVVPLVAVASLLDRLTSTALEPSALADMPAVGLAGRMPTGDQPMNTEVEQIGKPSPFACPDCHGVLFELEPASLPAFRCHVGHRYSLGSLVAAIADGIEDALWNAMRALQEGGKLMERLAAHVESHHGAFESATVAAQALDARRQAGVMRELLEERVRLDTPGRIPT
jgi:two-component system, chemotaxis family, protein-glutamate methylesterase/glutaminase